jgi:DNA-binding beta-propeller fold protein YncE
MTRGTIAREVTLTAAFWLAAGAANARAQTSGCNAPAGEPVVDLQLPGTPFEALPSADGCWIFVTLTTQGGDDDGSVAVIHRSDGKLAMVRDVPVKGQPTGAVLTHDGRLMVVAAGEYVDYLDVDRLTSGTGDPVLGDPGAGAAIGLVYDNVSNDDKWLFLSAERAAAVIVVDLDQARASGFMVLRAQAVIHTGLAPIAVTTSPDGRYLYITSEVAPNTWGWPVACSPEARRTAPPNHAEGSVQVVDLTRLPADSTHAVVSRTPVGCSPVRLVLSPSGGVAYVSVRGNDALRAFDTAKLIRSAPDARIGSVPVGTAPVGVAVIDSGRMIVVTNSNRFAGSGADHQNLTVIDAARLSAGKGAVVGTIPAGGFPRELRVTADGRTLVGTNFTSRTLELVDLERAIAGAAK